MSFAEGRKIWRTAADIDTCELHPGTSNEPRYIDEQTVERNGRPHRFYFQHSSQRPKVKKMIQLSRHKASQWKKNVNQEEVLEVHGLSFVLGLRDKEGEHSSPWHLHFRVTWRQEQNNSNYSVWLQTTETARDTRIRNSDTTKRKGPPNNPIGLRHLKSLKLFNLFYKSPALLLEIQWGCTHAWTLQASFILQGKNQESFKLSHGKELATQWGQTSDKTTNWVR